MKSIKPSWIAILSVFIGLALVCTAVFILISDVVSTKDIEANSERALLKMDNLLPTIVDKYPEERYNDSMPTMEIEGLNVAGMIEIPQYNRKMIINAEWDKKKVSSIPCRFTGCVYNRSLIVGGSDAQGQFDFVSSMKTGETIYITDMEGGRYTYTVKKIEHSGDASLDKLQSGDWDLTVFVKDTSSSGYLLVRCGVG